MNVDAQAEDRSTQLIDELRIRQYIDSIKHRGLRKSIPNLNCDWDVLSLNGFEIPMARNDVQVEQSYVASQIAHYVACAAEEAERELPRALSLITSLILKGLGMFLHWAKVDKVLYVNNLLVSTNLFPKNFEHTLDELHHQLTCQNQSLAIVFRSINPTFDPEVYAKLRSLGYKLVPSRKTYFIDATNPKIFQIKNFKHDLRLIQRHGYEVKPVGPNHYADYVRLAELYRLLYIEKYSKFNPSYTADYIQAVVESGFCTVLAIVKDGRADGFLGYYRRGGVITTPLFGYDTKLDIEIGLYRMISATSLLEAKRLRCVSHESSGAAQFKRLRGATSGYEYTAVYLDHLPFKTRCAWFLINFFTRTIAVPVIHFWGL